MGQAAIGAGDKRPTVNRYSPIIGSNDVVFDEAVAALRDPGDRMVADPSEHQFTD
jgi:hypothetical protein